MDPRLLAQTPLPVSQDHHFLPDSSVDQPAPQAAPVRHSNDGWITTQAEWNASMEEVETEPQPVVPNHHLMARQPSDPHQANE